MSVDLSELAFQLNTIRRAVDAALAELAAVGGACPHPEGRRLQVPVMGAPEQFFCNECNMLVDPQGGSGGT